MKEDNIRIKDLSCPKEKSDGIVYYQDKPFNGWWDTYQGRGRYQEGKKCGVWIERSSCFVTKIFYDNGKILGACESKAN